MLRPRVVPILLLKGDSLVKTVKFSRPTHIGDPINAVRIFNDLEVDELVFLDIDASKEGREPNFKLIEHLAEECFMPFAYGGGITTLKQIKQILASGVEKVVINSATTTNGQLIREAAGSFGSQSVVAGVDVRKRWLGGYEVLTYGGTTQVSKDPVAWCRRVSELGAGEICLTAIHKDGTWDGFDLDLVRAIVSAVTVPVIAVGGAGCVDDLRAVIHEGGASAAGAGSMFVFQKKGLGVLINYPRPVLLEEIIRNH